MSAVFQEFHQWESAPAFKLLSDNRDLYQLQSQRTRNGVVAPFPGAQPAIALPSKPQSPAAAGWAPILHEASK